MLDTECVHVINVLVGVAVLVQSHIVFRLCTADDIVSLHCAFTVFVIIYQSLLSQLTDASSPTACAAVILTV